MGAKTPSSRSRTKSSAGPSTAGETGAARRATRRAPAALRGRGVAVDTETLLTGFDAGRIPGSLYLEGPDEALKAALLAELRHAWHREVPESPAAVFRAAEAGVDQILAAAQGGSLFSPRELSIVLDVEDLGRSEKRVAALAEGIGRTGPGCSLVLVESAADSARKSLAPLRAAVEGVWTAWPAEGRALARWGERRLARHQVQAEPGVLALVVERCEGDAASFFSEVDKLALGVEPGARLTRAEAERLLRPILGAEVPDYLAALAAGDAALAARRLSRVVASGVGEGTVLFAVGNLVGGALGGWARHRELSEVLRRRASPRELARMLDAVYRAEAAWKRGRGDVMALLEQTTRVVGSATPAPRAGITTPR